MVLGSVTFDEENTNLLRLNVSFLRHCRYYVRYQCKAKDHKEYQARLNKLQQEIHDLYHIDGDVFEILLTLINFLEIKRDHSLVLNEGKINGTPVTVLYKLICFGNLSVKGVSILQDAIKYALLRKELSRYYGN